MWGITEKIRDYIRIYSFVSGCGGTLAKDFAAVVCFDLLGSGLKVHTIGRLQLITVKVLQIIILFLFISSFLFFESGSAEPTGKKKYWQ